MGKRKYNLQDLKDYREAWDNVQTQYMDPEIKYVFEQRKQAVDLYIDGIPIREIEESTGVLKGNLARIVTRCIKINDVTGQQYGYSALIPQKKLQKNSSIQIKDSATKTKGAFQQLLYTHPSLRTFIQDNYIGNREATLEKRITPSNLHKKFLLECKNLKIPDYKYPFNTTDKARRTFYKYLQQLEDSAYAVKRESKEIQRKYYSTGKEKRIRPYPVAPFSVVQLDGHRIDLLYSVEITNKHGEKIRKPATRLWIIAVIDVATRAILGYSLSTNENYDQTDVLRAIRNAIIPKSLLDFTLPQLHYPDHYGFHSLMIPETEWAMPEIIMMDNAKAHLATRVLDKLSTQLFCTLNFGSVATPETRGVIERWFKTIEDNGYHRLPSTTGSNINDVRRAEAEDDCVKYAITYDDVVQLTEYFIANYNVAPHSSLDNESPLERMKRRICEDGMQPCIANNEMKKKAYELTNIVEKKRIRGNVKAGKRPYITYEGVEYRNKILAESAGLIGNELIIEANPDDVSNIRAYFLDGTDLGILWASGEWGLKSHSLKTRKEALRFAKENKNKSEPFFAPLTELEKELNKRAETQRRARTKAMRVKKEQKDSLSNENTTGIDRILEENSLKTDFAINSDMTSEDIAIRKKREGYTAEQLSEIIKAGSLENAFKKGLI